MRTRLSLYLNSLSLEEILYLEEEIDRRKDRYRETYAVLSVQTDRRVLQAGSHVNLGSLARDMRKYIADCAAQGGGMQLAYSPEVSVIMFTTVEGASRTCSALLSKLPELNGKSADGSYQINLKLGLACGEDTLAPGSPRCVRTSSLVKRANQAAWRSSAGTLLMDECSYKQWPEGYKAARMPIEIDGQPIYRAVPSRTGNAETFDNERLNEFLAKVSRAGITTLKYDLERHDDVSSMKSSSSISTAIADLHLEGYDFRSNENLKYTERLSASGYADRLESIRRILSDMGLALVRFDTASTE
jgi:hypothetical protein